MPAVRSSPNVLLRRLIALAVASCALGGAATAEDPPHRSIEQRQLHPKNDLDWPQFIRRRSQAGWEYRSRHFTVVCTTGPDQAEWIARDLESTWRRIGRLADFWTDAHRQPTFCIAAVSVLVTSDWRSGDHGLAPGGPRTLNDDPNIYVSLAPGEPDLAKQLPQVRRESVRSFIRMTQLDQVLPEWVQTGLAEYIATREGEFADTSAPGSPLPDTPRSEIRPKIQELSAEAGSAVVVEAGSANATPPASAATVESPASPSSSANQHGDLPVFLDEIPQRTTENSVPPEKTDPVQAGQWVRFLLESYDARYAPLLLMSLGKTVSDRPEQREFWSNVSQGVWQPPFDLPRFREDWQPADLVVLSRQATATQFEDQWRHWRSDPLAGQPVLKDAGRLDRETIAEIGRMILLLKLADRFRDAGPTGTITPRTTVFDDSNQSPDESHGSAPPAADQGDATAPSATDIITRPLDFTALYRRLTDPATGPWATVEADGTLLFWTDHEQVDELFDDARYRYRTYLRDGRNVVQARLSGGRTLDVWLEDNPGDPLRPIARAATTP